MREASVGANVDNGELFLMETKVFPPLRKKKKAGGSSKNYNQKIWQFH